MIVLWSVHKRQSLHRPRCAIWPKFFCLIADNYTG